MSNRKKLKQILELLGITLNIDNETDRYIDSLLLDIEFCISDYTTP